MPRDVDPRDLTRASGGGLPVPALLAWGRERLEGLEGAGAALEARSLLEWAMGVGSLWSAPTQVGARDQERYRQAVAMRRHGTPLQHIVGRMWFRGLELEARPGVFVVRPETETLAGMAVDAARSVAGRAPVVVDLCTGSGAIAVSVAAEVPSARVLAVEIDEAAAALARANAGRIVPGRVRILHGDAMSLPASVEGQVDVVVSNPPYVPPSEMPTQREAACDPDTALRGGGEDGLVIPRGIVNRGRALLAPGGHLLVEHSPTQAQAMRRIARDAGLVDVRTVDDLTGRPRFLAARTAAQVEG